MDVEAAGAWQYPPVTLEDVDVVLLDGAGDETDAGLGMELTHGLGDSPSSTFA